MQLSVQMLNYQRTAKTYIFCEIYHCSNNKSDQECVSSKDDLKEKIPFNQKSTKSKGAISQWQIKSASAHYRHFSTG